MPADAVRVFLTFWNSRSTPASKTSSSRRSALNPLITRTPPRVSVSLPVTSAINAPRSRKAGRSTRKVFIDASPNAPSGISERSVSTGSMLRRIVNAITEVSTPPTTCTNPVPTRFRTPSTSFITRETSTPDLVLSKTRIGSRSTCFCTRARSCEISCWASTLSSRVSRKPVVACRKVAAPTIETSVQS